MIELLTLRTTSKPHSNLVPSLVRLENSDYGTPAFGVLIPWMFFVNSPCINVQTHGSGSDLETPFKGDLDSSREFSPFRAPTRPSLSQVSPMEILLGKFLAASSSIHYCKCSLRSSVTSVCLHGANRHCLELSSE